MRFDRSIPTVLLPIEIGTRELDSKLVLASALAAEGCRSVVGHKEALKTIAQLAKGVVWQGKSLFSGKSTNHIADRILGNNSAIMFLHDEGGIHQVSAWKQNVLKKHRVDDLRKRRISRLCVWGEKQKEVISDFAPELSNALVVTGSPRFDLCLPSYSWLTDSTSRQGLATDGPYILACSRFVNAAHAEGQEAPFLRRLYSTGWPASFDAKSVADVVFTQWRQAVQDFADFVVLIKEIAVNYPRYKVVLRPHPSENLNFYKQAFSRFDNVDVRRDDSVLCWIRSAELVIHSNCTTGIEAVLAGRPVVNLLPAHAARAEVDLEVAREAGCVATSIPDALEKIAGILSGEMPKPVWSENAKTILNNLKRDAIPLLVKQTLNVVNEQRLSSSQLLLPGLRLGNFLTRLRNPQTNLYVASKRGGALRGEHVEMLVDGCTAHNVGKGRVRHVAKEYVVVEP